jgi:flagellar biosynthesis chaperone FliJ
MSASQFPLEPLCKVRGMRLRKLEADMKACREQWNAAEQLRLEAVERWEQATWQRDDFVEASWKKLFGSGMPTGEAMSRHERHLAWLDQLITQRHAELEKCSRECNEAAAALEVAAAAWRRAHSKLDALGEMKQEWLREARSKQALHEEHSLEELMLRRTTSR